MNNKYTLPISLALSLILNGISYADETESTDATVTESELSNTIGTSVVKEGKLTDEFSEFLGGEEQAAGVIDSLRQGKSFSLATDTSETGTTTDSSNSVIEPPTGSMGYGNVKITLKLAEAKLAEMGINQPTNEQFSAVLLGGEINGQPVDGILALRSEGMGWGEIAKQYDMKVGQLMGNAKPSAPQTTPQLSTDNNNGYIAPYSKKSASTASRHHSNGYIPSSKNVSAGKGFVTANGTSANQPGYMKENGKIKAVKTAKVHTANKHGFIPSSSPGRTTTVSSAAANTHSSMGKAKGHSHKK